MMFHLICCWTISEPAHPKAWSSYPLRLPYFSELLGDCDQETWLDQACGTWLEPHLRDEWCCLSGNWNKI